MKLGMWELILLLVLALVIFGPSKLPEVGKSLGKALSEFKDQVNHPEKEDENKERDQS